MHGKEVEGQLKAAEVRMQQAAEVCEAAKAQTEAKDREGRDLVAHIQKMRQKQNEQNVIIEKLNGQAKEVAEVVNEILGSSKAYLEGFMQMLKNSETMVQVVPKTIQERLKSLEENQATSQSEVIESLHYMSTFMTFAGELDSLLASEVLDRLQSLVNSRN